MNFEILESAEQEFLETVSHYEKNAPGLGARFAKAVEECFEGIRKWPEICKQLKGGYRHRGIQVFPYAVIYKIFRNTIYIIAIAPCKRRPYYWIQHRLR